MLNGGTTSLNGAIGQFVGDVGVMTNRRRRRAMRRRLSPRKRRTPRCSVSGVNLDEEAANLLRYQQAYMAISQMIRVADSCFQSVLDATRR